MSQAYIQKKQPLDPLGHMIVTRSRCYMRGYILSCYSSRVPPHFRYCCRHAWRRENDESPTRKTHDHGYFEEMIDMINSEAIMDSTHIVTDVRFAVNRVSEVLRFWHSYMRLSCPGVTSDNPLFPSSLLLM